MFSVKFSILMISCLIVLAISMRHHKPNGDKPNSMTRILGRYKDITEKNVDDPIVNQGTQTPQPTKAPITEPTLSPSSTWIIDPICYGGEDINIVNDSYAETILYNYEIVTTQNSDINQVLGSLEIFIANNLASLYRDDCNNDSQGGKNDSQEGRILSGLQVQGLSAMPLDQVKTERECQAPPADGNHVCNVVEGRLTLYLSDQNDSQKERALSKIEEDMHNGSYNSADTSIITLRFLTDADIDNVNGQGEEDEKDSVGGELGMSQEKAVGTISLAPFIATGACAVLIGLVLGRRYLNKTNEVKQLEKVGTGSLDDYDDNGNPTPYSIDV